MCQYGLYIYQSVALLIAFKQKELCQLVEELEATIKILILHANYFGTEDMIFAKRVNNYSHGFLLK